MQIDDDGRLAWQTTFAPDDLEAALAALHAGGEEVRSTSAWRALQRLTDAINAHDWDALMASIAPGYQVYDRRGSITAPDGTDPVAVYRILFSLDDWSMAITPIDRHGDRRVLARYLTRFRDGAVADSEVESLVLVESDAHGRLISNTTFAPDDLDAALSALHADEPTAGASPPQENDAWRASTAFRRAFESRDDWDAITATLADGFVYDDRRTGVRVHATGDDALALYRTAFELDEYRWHGTLVTTKGDRLVVIRDHVTFADQQTGGAEVASVSLVESAPDGRVLGITAFDEADLAGALAELDRRYEQQLVAAESAAWRVSLAQRRLPPRSTGMRSRPRCTRTTNTSSADGSCGRRRRQPPTRSTGRCSPSTSGSSTGSCWRRAATASRSFASRAASRTAPRGRQSRPRWRSSRSPRMGA